MRIPSRIYGAFRAWAKSYRAPTPNTSIPKVAFQAGWEAACQELEGRFIGERLAVGIVRDVKAGCGQ